MLMNDLISHRYSHIFDRFGPFNSIAVKGLC